VFDLGIPWWEIIVRTAVAYGVLLFGFRIFGRRQLGQLTPFDLVVVLLIANALQNAMVGSDTSLVGGGIAAVTLLAVNRGVAIARRWLPGFERAAEGEPVLLVSGGKVLSEHLARQEVDLADLEQAAREHGVSDLSDVDAAVLEVDGTVSIIPRSAHKITTRRRIRRRQQY
jgi:uncharacterized membrane protein YcaP (DUF421 family)